MHPLFEKASGLTESIIGAAIEVHRDKGPGLIESIYEWCLAKEFELRGLPCLSQKLVVIAYKGFTREEALRCDLLVEDCVLVEAKAVETILPIHKAQLLSYMKLLDIPIGLLINFHEMKLTDGVHCSPPDPSRRKPMKSIVEQKQTEKGQTEKISVPSVCSC